MTNTFNALRLDRIRETIREPLRLFTERLGAGLADNLKSVTVVGSSLTDDFRADSSDINTVVILNEHSTASLRFVASLARPLRKTRVAPPLLVTLSYIERSRDVFGVEFLDFQLTHETILGDDPFTSLSFEREDVRLQCERELKAALVRLRQGYLASGGDAGRVRDLVIEAGKGLVSVTRAMLWLKGVERPRTMAASLHKAAEQFQVDLRAAAAAGQWRYQKSRLTPAGIEGVFAAVFAAVDRLTTTIDRFEL